MNQARVFISYQRTDGEFARQVRDHLVSAGVKTWMDQYDIPVGAYWPDEIDAGLTTSDIVVGILSPDAMASRNVKNEWDWAIQNDKRLLLLQVKPCVIPHRYVSINFIDAVTHDPSHALAALLETLGIAPGATSEFTPPVTRYARAGDVSVAYQVVGDGPVDFVHVPGFISHIEHMWISPVVARFLHRIASYSRLILFDKRGTGLSDRIAGVSTMEDRMDDIRAVMDAAGSERAVIYGLSEGAALAALFAATHPERTVSLILYGGFASYVRQPDYPWAPTADEKRRAIDARAATIHETWGSITSVEADLQWLAPSALHDADVMRWFATLQKIGSSPGAEIARQRMNLELDIRHVLPVIRVPTLVVHRTDDRDTPVEAARYIAKHIPDAQFVELPGIDHWPWIGDMDSILDEIDAFVTGAQNGALTEADRVLVTILVVEFVGSAAADALKRAARAELTRFRGREFGSADHRLLASFDGPGRAIRCAAAIVKATHPLGITIRAGLHTGEVEVAGDIVRGMNVEIAAGVASLAKTSEILTSNTVKDLVAGSGIRFEDRGTMTLPDAPDDWRVFAVDRTSVSDQ